MLKKKFTCDIDRFIQQDYEHWYLEMYVQQV